MGTSTSPSTWRCPSQAIPEDSNCKIQERLSEKDNRLKCNNFQKPRPTPTPTGMTPGLEDGLGLGNQSGHALQLGSVHTLHFKPVSIFSRAWSVQKLKTAWPWSCIICRSGWSRIATCSVVVDHSRRIFLTPLTIAAGMSKRLT